MTFAFPVVLSLLLFDRQVSTSRGRAVMKRATHWLRTALKAAGQDFDDEDDDDEDEEGEDGEVDEEAKAKEVAAAARQEELWKLCSTPLIDLQTEVIDIAVVILLLL
jgi:hypothetical protein